MDFDKLNALMDWMSTKPLSELEWSEGDETIKLVKANGTVIRDGADDHSPASAPKPEAQPAEAEGLVKAPFLGIVHLTPSPDAEPYVKIGQSVSAGDTVCSIEAMKVFNSVSAEIDGVVEAILVSANEQVSLGQPLFKISPN